MQPRQPVNNRLMKYRIPITIVSVIMLLSIPFQVYYGPSINKQHLFQSWGHWANTSLTYFIIPVMLILYVRKPKAANEDV